jgi:hypothetical protein
LESSKCPEGSLLVGGRGAEFENYKTHFRNSRRRQKTEKKLKIEDI